MHIELSEMKKRHRYLVSKRYLQLECILYTFTLPPTPYEESVMTLKSFDSLLPIY